MDHKVLSHIDSFEIILNKLREGKPFSFVRFGDGDNIIMYKKSVGGIVGGNQVFVTQKLQDEIIECYNIIDNNFLVGTMLNDTSDYQMAKTNSNIDHSLLPDLIEREKMLAMSCLFEAFLNNIAKFKDFSNELKKTSTMFVCNYNHLNIEKVYGKIKVFIQVPKLNSYSKIEMWYPEIVKNLDKVDKIILSSGHSARVVTKRLFKAGVKKIVLDVGSLSDAFVFNTDIRKQIAFRNFMKRVEGRVNINAKILLTGRPFVAGNIRLVEKKLKRPKRLKRRIKR